MGAHIVTRMGKYGTHREYWFDNKRHRIDGPAIEYACGVKRWYYDDEFIDCKSQEEFERIIKLKAFW